MRASWPWVSRCVEVVDRLAVGLVFLATILLVDDLPPGMGTVLGLFVWIDYRIDRIDRGGRP